MLPGNSLADLWPRAYGRNTVIPANKFAVKKRSYATTLNQKKYEDMCDFSHCGQQQPTVQERMPVLKMI